MKLYKICGGKYKEFVRLEKAGHGSNKKREEALNDFVTKFLGARVILGKFIKFQLAILIPQILITFTKC